MATLSKKDVSFSSAQELESVKADSELLIIHSYLSALLCKI